MHTHTCTYNNTYEKLISNLKVPHEHDLSAQQLNLILGVDTGLTQRLKRFSETGDSRDHHLEHMWAGAAF